MTDPPLAEGRDGGARPAGARALWYVAPGRARLLDVELGPPARNQVRVETAYSALSRGTESLVFRGLVPEAEWRRMRAPLQEGEFPFPVKYGYAAAGTVAEGPAALVGRRVFCLHPHQSAFVADAAMVVPIPDRVPTRRAVLAANAETALNALWDAGAGPCDRIAVVGGGVVGLLVGWLAARMPGTRVTLVDVDPDRRATAEALGLSFEEPRDAPGGNDLVVHASATAAGLGTAIDLAGTEATVLEMSWYGDRRVEIGLGGLFHSGRLKLVSSQVGAVSPARRPRWTHRDRLAAALDLLDDARLDRLLEPDIAFDDLPDALPSLLGEGAPPRLCPVVAYA